MKALKLGIIGAGSFVIKRHIPEIIKEKKKIKLVSICRRNVKNLDKIGKKFKIKSLYTNHIEMLKREKLDVVLIASPHTLHYQHAVDVLKYNCHVIIEKPIATSVNDVKKIINLSIKKNKKVIPIYNPPYESHMMELKKLISNKKKFGKIEHVNLTWLDYKSPFFGKGPFIKSQISEIMPTNFRLNKNLSAGGILFDSGCHLIAELIWIINKKPKTIFANFDNLKTELRLSLSIEFNNLLFANINIIGDSNFKTRRLESCYWGEKQTIRLIGKPYTINVYNNKIKKVENIKKFKKLKTPIIESINHIKKNKKLEITLNQSLYIIAIIKHAYKSAKSKKKEIINY